MQKNEGRRRTNHTHKSKESIQEKKRQRQVLHIVCLEEVSVKHCSIQKSKVCNSATTCAEAKSHAFIVTSLDNIRDLN